MPALQALPQATVPPAPVATERMDAAQRAREAINRAIPSLSPSQPASVPRGGLLQTIQNSNRTDRGTHIEKVEIRTDKPLTPHELEGLLEMAG